MQISEVIPPLFVINKIDYTKYYILIKAMEEPHEIMVIIKMFLLVSCNLMAVEYTIVEIQEI